MFSLCRCIFCYTINHTYTMAYTRLYFIFPKIQATHGLQYLVLRTINYGAIVTCELNNSKNCICNTSRAMYNKINQLFFINLAWENPALMECHITNLRNSFTCIHILYTWRLYLYVILVDLHLGTKADLWPH